MCGSPPQPGEFEARNLFAPRSADAAQGTRLVCAHGHGDYLKEHIIRSSGWNFEVERNSQGLAKPGYIARTPGRRLSFATTAAAAPRSASGTTQSSDRSRCVESRLPHEL